jgi:hypothetical protein
LLELFLGFVRQFLVFITQFVIAFTLTNYTFTDLLVELHSLPCSHFFKIVWSWFWVFNLWNVLDYCVLSDILVVKIFFLKY